MENKSNERKVHNAHKHIVAAKSYLAYAIDSLNYAMTSTVDTLDLRDEKHLLQEVYDKLTEAYNNYAIRMRNN